MSTSTPRPPKTPPGRVAYPQFVEARPRSEGKPPRFSCTLVFDESVDLTAMKEAVRAAVLKDLNGKPVPPNFRNPFRSGEERRRDDGTMPDGFKPTDTFVEFWRYEKHGAPGTKKCPTVDQWRNPLPPGDVYAGMLGIVVFKPFCYNTDGNRGVSLSLEGFQKKADGTPIGSAPIDVDNAFDVESDEEAPVSSSAAGGGYEADEMPF